MYEDEMLLTCFPRLLTYLFFILKAHPQYLEADSQIQPVLSKGENIMCIPLNIINTVYAILSKSVWSPIIHSLGSVGQSLYNIFLLT